METIAIIGEVTRVHGLVAASELDDYLDDVMLKVGLDPAYERRYPHQFSGDQRVRIGIARALAVRPEFLVCDESVAAFDLSIQARRPAATSTRAVPCLRVVPDRAPGAPTDRVRAAAPRSWCARPCHPTGTSKPACSALNPAQTLR